MFATPFLPAFVFSQFCGLVLIAAAAATKPTIYILACCAHCSPDCVNAVMVRLARVDRRHFQVRRDDDATERFC
jgi:hypothetical protein